MYMGEFPAQDGGWGLPGNVPIRTTAHYFHADDMKESLSGLDTEKAHH